MLNRSIIKLFDSIKNKVVCNILGNDISLEHYKSEVL